MADIVKVICTDNFGNYPRRLVAGIRPDQTFYFENDYTCIPNEFELAPAYFPKMFFTAVVSCLDALIKNHVDDPEVLYYHWYFTVFYRGGQHKTFKFTEAEVNSRAAEIKRYFRYNDFLDDAHKDPATKKFLQTSTSLITLQNVRGQVAREYVMLDEFFERCSKTYSKDDFNSANYILSHANDGGLRFSLKRDPENTKDTLIVKIDADGTIKADGCIPYIRLLKDRGVRVITPQHDSSKDVMPFMTVDDYTRYRDPKYLVSSLDQEFSFEDEDEYQLFLKYHQGIGEVAWPGGDEYASLYKQAYKTVGELKFSEGLQQLHDCLAINPVAIAARFEMVNCLIGLKEYEEAKKCLVILSQFLEDGEDKAKLYRLFGYIFTEEKLYPAAYVCYRQSLEVCYGENDYAVQQMIWVEKTERELHEQQRPMKGYDVQWWENIEESLKYYRIPVLERW